MQADGLAGKGDSRNPIRGSRRRLARHPAIACILLQLLFLPVHSQDYLWKEVLNDRDLAGGSIRLAFMDSCGYVLVWTSGGLYRTDGHEIRAVPLPDSLANSQVSAFASLDRDHVLLGLDNGIVLKYNGNMGRMDYLGDPGRGSGIKAILVGGDSRVWMATYGNGLARLSDTLERFGEKEGILSDYSYCLGTDSSGRIWAGTDGGINILSESPGGLSIESISHAEGLPDYIVTAISPAPSGNMMAGFESGYLCMLDPGTLAPAKEWENWHLEGPVDRITGSGNMLWILSGGQIYRFKEPVELSSVPAGESVGSPGSGRILGLFRDGQDNLWAAGEHSLLLSSPLLKIFSREGDFSYLNCQCAMEDRQGRLWFGIRNILYMQDLRMRGKAHMVLESHAASSVISLFEDSKGWIWTGTFNRGLYIIDPASMKTRKLTASDGLPDNNILSINGTGDEIWLASLGGISRVRVDRKAFYDASATGRQVFQTEQVPGLNYVYDIQIGPDGRVWFGTDGDGIYSTNGGEPVKHSIGGLEDAVVLSIAKDPDGNLWFGTSNRGFYRYDGTAFRHFQAADGGLRSDFLAGIESDAEGNLIILHNKGIDLYLPEEDSYLYLDDLTDTDLRGSGFNSLSRGEDGAVWISSGSGIVRYSAQGMKNPPVPETLITSVDVLNRKIDHETMHRFRHSENHFRISSTSIWYPAPERIRYRYKLEGLETEWMETRSRQVSYSALPPGNYRFSIQSGYNSNFSNANTAGYAFHIRKPFWRMTWFLVLSSMLFLASLLAVVRERERRFRIREAEARKLLSLQLESLQNQVNPHFLFNSFNTLVSVIDEDRKLAIDYVEHLSDFFRNVLVYSTRRLIPMSEELELLGAYAFLQQKRYGESLVLETGLGEKAMNSRIPPLTLQILVENAVKHNVVSLKTPLLVRICEKSGGICVENNLQPKKNAEPSTGTGLENIRNRYEMLGGEPVRIENDGEKFIVILPYIISHDQGSDH